MTAALVITSGRSASTPGFNPLEPVGGITAVERLILVFQQAGVERVVLCGGRSLQELGRQVSRMGVVLLGEEAGEDAEMLDYVKTGLGYLAGKCDAALITPVDVPLFSAGTVERLAESGAPVAIPSHGGRAGHPMRLAVGLFGEVLAYTGGGGLAGAVKSLATPIEYLDVPDEGVLLDIGRRGDYGEVLRQHSLQRLRCEVKVSVAREKVFFGPGPHQLFGQIEETGSLRAACQQMGISYSKGWKIIENAEEQLGFKLVVRSRGGAEKGKTRMTPEGADWLRRYTAFSKACKRQAEVLFSEYFGAESAEIETPGGL